MDDLVIVLLNDGLNLVGSRNAAGGVTALHSNPISTAAAVKMADELQREPSPTDRFDEIAAGHELKARILAEIGNLNAWVDERYPHNLADEVAGSLAATRPWERCHKAPEPEPDEIPF